MTQKATINGKVKTIKDYEVINLGSRKNPEIIVLSVTVTLPPAAAVAAESVTFCTARSGPI